MATVIEKPVRLVNPGHRKSGRRTGGPRRMTARQKLFFGSKRQRAAVQRTLHNSRKEYGGRTGGNRKMIRSKKSGSFAKQDYYHNKHVKRRRAFRRRTDASRLPNVGEIITIHPLLNSGQSKIHNPRKRKGNLKNKMAKSYKRRTISHQAAVRRAKKAARTRARHRNRSNPAPVRHHRRRRRNPVTTVTRYKVRNAARRSYGHRRRSYRRHRNPGMLGSGMFKSAIGQAVGVVGGAFVTSMAYGAVTSFMPSLSNGIMSYLAIGVIATLQGQMVGKLLKNPALGRDMTVGGFVFLALKVAKDMFPSVNLGISGMGMLGPSSFWTPQVPLAGSMGTFVTPAGLMAAIPQPTTSATGRGMGVVRRGGRMR